MTPALMQALTLADGAHPLVHLNAALNTLATILLVTGQWQIKRKRESAHGRTMIAAFAVSTAFLISYVIYHVMVGRVEFTHPGAIRYVYRTILLSHIVLAFTVPGFALASLWFGARALGWGRAAALPVEARTRSRLAHIRLVRWAFPIWLYVSVTGVAVYAMLYHLWPSADVYPTLNAALP